ncbi:MAG TPA: discoidin domain-containing protein [Myxococcota bacterium]|nr:discoidin domain-containing protein [Myxococcota bacterium]
MVVLLLFALLFLEPTARAETPQPIKVVAVKVSSALPKWKGYTFDAANLIDGRVDTSWQPAKSDTLGVGQWVELDLGGYYQIDRLEIAQGLQKTDPELGDLFCRNNRFADARIFFEDGTYAAYWAEPFARELKIEVFSRGPDLPENGDKTVVTRFLRLVVESVHEPVDWKDLAIAEVRVFGRPAPAIPADPTSITWDRPGAWSLKTAIIEACATKAARRNQLGCNTLLSAIAEGGEGLEKLAPITTSDLAKGRVTFSFTSIRVRFQVELQRETSGSWTLKRVTRLDATGKPAEPEYAYPPQSDYQHKNDCWEKLGKVRPCDATGEHIPEFPE